MVSGDKVKKEIDDIFIKGRGEASLGIDYDDSANLRSKGIRQWLDFEHDESIKSFEKLTAVDPTAESYRMRGDAYARKLTDFNLEAKPYIAYLKNAMFAYEQSLSCQRTEKTYLNYIDLLANKHRSHVTRDNFDKEALMLCEEAREYFQDSMEIHANYYKFCKSRSLENEALKLMVHAVRLNPTNIDFLLENFGTDLWKQKPKLDEGYSCPIDIVYANLGFWKKKEGLHSYFRFVREHEVLELETTQTMVQLLYGVFLLDPYYKYVAKDLKDYAELEVMQSPSIEPARKRELDAIIRESEVVLEKIYGKVIEADCPIAKASPGSALQIVKKQRKQFPTPKEIKKVLDEYMIGQDSAKIDLCTAVYEHFKRIDLKSRGKYIEKSNIILLGPTGVGKTFSAQKLAQIVELPLAIFDASGLTEAGYVGDNVEDIVVQLLDLAGGNVHKAQRGIVYVDEIDKVRSSLGSGGRDVSGRGAQQSLLTIINGGTINLASDRNTKITSFDSSDLLFVCGGSFAGSKDVRSIYEIIEDSKKSSAIEGFVKKASENERLEEFERKQKEVRPEHLIEFGIIPELVGRLHIITNFDYLTFDEMRRILYEPKHSLLEQFTTSFAEDGIRLELKDDAMDLMVYEATRRGQGARSLRSICAKVFRFAQYELPGTGSKELVVEKGQVIEALYGNSLSEEEIDRLVEKNRNV
ncbi:MAG: AAA family ATPase [Candidatus Woesearchaeota archaeon]